MGTYATEMTAWFEAMYALAPVAVTMGEPSAPVRAVQDESSATDMLMAGGPQGTVEGSVFVLKAECPAPPEAKARITVDGRAVRILQLHTEPADPTWRITYGKL